VPTEAVPIITFNFANVGDSGAGSTVADLDGKVPSTCTVACSDDVIVTAHWDGGAPHAADVVVNTLKLSRNRAVGFIDWLGDGSFFTIKVIHRL
jgi:hypothetical protein